MSTKKKASICILSVYGAIGVAYANPYQEQPQYNQSVGSQYHAPIQQNSGQYYPAFPEDNNQPQTQQVPQYQPQAQPIPQYRAPIQQIPQYQPQIQQMPQQSQPSVVIYNNNSPQANVTDSGNSTNTNTNNNASDKTNNHIRSWLKDSIGMAYIEIGGFGSINDSKMNVKINYTQDITITNSSTSDTYKRSWTSKDSLVYKASGAEIKGGINFKILKFNENTFDIGVGVEGGLSASSISASVTSSIDKTSFKSTFPPDNDSVNKLTNNGQESNASYTLSFNNAIIGGFISAGWNVSDTFRASVNVGYRQEFDIGSTKDSASSSKWSYSSDISEAIDKNKSLSNSEKFKYEGHEYFANLSLDFGSLYLFDSSNFGIKAGISQSNSKLILPSENRKIDESSSGYSSSYSNKTESKIFAKFEDDVSAENNSLRFSLALKFGISF